MRKRALHNWQYKVAAFVIAVLIWLFINAEHQPRFRTDYPVRVQYENMAVSLRLTSSKDVVLLKLQGDPTALNNITDDKLTARVNLAGLAEGRHRVRVKITNNTGARIVRKNVTLNVELTNLNSIEIPVKLAFFGALPVGTRLGEVTLTPEKVIVYGKTDELAGVDHVVANINLANRRKTFRESLFLNAVDAEGSTLDTLKIEPLSIEAEVPVEKEFVKVVPVSPRFKKGSGAKGFGEAEFFPTVVKLVGNEDALKRIKKIDTEEFDLSRCREGGVFPLKLLTPKNVFTDVQRVTMSCGSDHDLSLSFIVTVKVINGCEGCETSVQPSRVKVVATGPTPNVNHINISQISAVADVLGLNAGAHRVDLHVSLTSGMEKVNLKFEPARVIVIISGKEE